MTPEEFVEHASSPRQSWSSLAVGSAWQVGAGAVKAGYAGVGAAVKPGLSGASRAIGNFADAVGGGGSMMAGFFPVTGNTHMGGNLNFGVHTPVGQELRHWGPLHFMANKRSGAFAEPARLLSEKELSNIPLVDQPKGYHGAARTGLIPSKTGPMSYLPGVLGAGASAYFMYQGYQENGFKGLYDAAIYDLAANTALHNVGYQRHSGGAVQKGLGALGGVTTASTGWFGSGGLSMAGIGAGAYAGATVGQSIAGTPGAFAGAFIGAKAFRSPGRAAVTALALGGAYAVSKGAYSILKTGYRKGAARRSIDTAGDTASFFTQNAHTMRSRAVQAMHKSHTNARSALGQEASFMHMNRDYFSTYRRAGNMM